MKQNITPYLVLASTIDEVMPFHLGLRHSKQNGQKICSHSQSHGSLLTSLLYRVLFPTVFRVVILSLGICFIMSSCTNAAKEAVKVIP
jgi:hypothetical protein